MKWATLGGPGIKSWWMTSTVLCGDLDSGEPLNGEHLSYTFDLFGTYPRFLCFLDICIYYLLFWDPTNAWSGIDFEASIDEVLPNSLDFALNGEYYTFTLGYVVKICLGTLPNCWSRLTRAPSCVAMKVLGTYSAGLNGLGLILFYILKLEF